MIPEIANLPDISFIENKTLDDIQKEMVADYEKKYKEVTGKSLSLKRSDPETLMLYAASVQIYHMLLHVDKTGKMDLLKYAYGDFLENLGALRGVTRSPASPAECTVRFTLSAVQPSSITIPAGTKVSNGEGIYFATDEAYTIQAGGTYVDIPCTCNESGTKGNGLIAGTINILVNPVPYVASVANIDTTAGGSDVESDEDLAERIYLAPGSYSTAGARDAYIYHTKSYSSSVGDVEVTSPSACHILIKLLMDDGTLPNETMCANIQEYLSAENLRPLTDYVTVSAPNVQDFTVDLDYYINESDKDKESLIQSAVEAAVSDYITWQSTKIGRDVNPSVLIQKVVEAGAKRVTVNYPSYAVVPSGYVAQLLGSAVINYAGREAD